MTGITVIPTAILGASISLLRDASEDPDVPEDLRNEFRRAAAILVTHLPESLGAAR